MDLLKPTKQADTKKRLIFSFREIPEVREALKTKDEVHTAVRALMAQEPLEVQVGNLRELIVKMLQRLNKTDSTSEIGEPGPEGRTE